MKNVPTTTVACGNFPRDSWHKCSECLYSVNIVQEQFSCSRLDFVTYLAKLLLALEIGKCEIAESSESWSFVRRVLGVK
jgi:hypothetical protein